jgi:ribosomal protein L21E
MIVTKEMYKVGQRYYIDIDERRVKIPWRYNRPMLVSSGLKTIFEYKVGDDITCKIESKLWEGETHLILKSIAD